MAKTSYRRVYLGLLSIGIRVHRGRGEGCDCSSSGELILELQAESKKNILGMAQSFEFLTSAPSNISYHKGTPLSLPKEDYQLRTKHSCSDISFVF